MKKNIFQFKREEVRSAKKRVAEEQKKNMLYCTKLCNGWELETKKYLKPGFALGLHTARDLSAQQPLVSIFVVLSLYCPHLVTKVCRPVQKASQYCEEYAELRRILRTSQNTQNAQCYVVTVCLSVLHCATQQILLSRYIRAGRICQEDIKIKGF